MYEIGAKCRLNDASIAGMYPSFDDIEITFTVAWSNTKSPSKSFEFAWLFGVRREANGRREGVKIPLAIDFNGVVPDINDTISRWG